MVCGLNLETVTGYKRLEKNWYFLHNKYRSAGGPVSKKAKCMQRLDQFHELAEYRVDIETIHEIPV